MGAFAAGGTIVECGAKTLRCLEWQELTELLAACAASAWGRELCLQSRPLASASLAERALAECEEAVSLAEAGQALVLAGLPDLREALARLEAGASLSAAELVLVAGTLRLCRQVRRSLAGLASDSFPLLAAYLPSLASLEPELAAIESCIDDSGTVRDDASPLLAALRAEAARLDRQIRELLTGMIHAQATARVLQEPLYTQRNGRYVLPVLASARQSVAGIVHDTSASGLTVYVEPLKVVELSNKVRMKEAESEREVARILAALSAQLRQQSAALSLSYRTLVQIDCLTARASFALKYGGVRPAISPEGKLLLRNARHPLLVLKDGGRASPVVPNTIELDADRRTMVVTGPNTGGKTVVLKTAGLLCLMGAAGMPVPVSPGSTMPFYARVFADIGDEQSLAQSLSTFSAHMGSIVEMVAGAAWGTLVLIDEIGAGTDPRQGAALARAILEHLNSVGATTIATTHYGELKSLAYQEGGFLNASLEFDDENLAPTYRLRVGRPGKSQATEIAGRLGLEASVLARARQLISNADDDAQVLMERLEAKLADLEGKETCLAEQIAEAGRLAREAESARVEAAQLKERLRSDYASQLEAELRAAKEIIRAITSDLQRQPTSAKAQKAATAIDAVSGAASWLAAPKAEGPAADLKVGQTVRVVALGKTGVVEALPDLAEGGPGAQVSVRVGSLKLKVKRSDLEVVAEKAPSAKKARPHPLKPEGKRTARPELFLSTLDNTLDLRGKRVDEALALVERFIDRAVLAGQAQVMIIHGHGTGALKACVRDCLASPACDLRFRPGGPHEGGDGVTIVDLG